MKASLTLSESRSQMTTTTLNRTDGCFFWLTLWDPWFRIISINSTSNVPPFLQLHICQKSHSFHLTLVSSCYFLDCKTDTSSANTSKSHLIRQESLFVSRRHFGGSVPPVHCRKQLVSSIPIETQIHSVHHHHHMHYPPSGQICKSSQSPNLGAVTGRLQSVKEID